MHPWQVAPDAGALLDWMMNAGVSVCGVWHMFSSLVYEEAGAGGRWACSLHGRAKPKALGTCLGTCDNRHEPRQVPRASVQ
jgi:hypothetical protein